MATSNARAAPLVWGELTESNVSTQSGMYPQDCATTLDNRRGAVRYAHPTNNAAIVAIYDLVGAVNSGVPGGALVTHDGNPWGAPVDCR